MKITNPFIVRILNKQTLHPLQAASNQSGNKLVDIMTKLDYTPPKRSSLVAYSELILPKKDTPEYIHLPEYLKLKRGALPDIVRNARNILWIKINAKEKRDNSQFARQFELVLPPEIPLKDAVKIVQDFAQAELINRGMVADFAIHENQQKKVNDLNHTTVERTAFLMCTTRPYSHGEFSSKPREWNDIGQFMSWRSSWFKHLGQAISSLEKKSQETNELLKFCTRFAGYTLQVNQDKEPVSSALSDSDEIAPITPPKTNTKHRL